MFDHVRSSILLSIKLIFNSFFALRPSKESKPTVTDSAVKKAEDVVSTMLAKGFILGKDALNKAKFFDERHHLISNASATVASIDSKIGLS